MTSKINVAALLSTLDSTMVVASKHIQLLAEVAAAQVQQPVIMMLMHRRRGTVARSEGPAAGAHCSATSILRRLVVNGCGSVVLERGGLCAPFGPLALGATLKLKLQFESCFTIF
jgi:hypothetical protein